MPSASPPARANIPSTKPPPSAEKRVCNLSSGRCFASLFEASLRVRDHQVIELQPGRYVGDLGLIRAHGVTVRAAAGGRASLLAGGRNLAGKGTMLIQGNDTLVEGIEFIGARAPHRNGAGIRHEGGNLTIRRCRFDDNEIGLLAGDHPTGHIQIIDSEFARSHRVEDARYPIRGYPSHNIYVGRYAKLTLRGVWSHSPAFGHPLKSRARESDIEASYFSTRDSTGSYEAEFPSGGGVRFVGNIVEQAESSDNIRMFVAGFEVAVYSIPGVKHFIEMHQNTFINRNPLRGDMVSLRQSALYAPRVRMSANLWFGPGSPRDLSNVRVLASHFLNTDACDYRPRVSEFSELPAFTPAATYEYVHPASHKPRKSNFVGAISADAAAQSLCTP